MLIKQKSLLVALISSLIIFLVLVLTLIGYVIYIELRGEELKRTYQVLLEKANATVYSKYIEISKLDARIELAGPLKEKPVIEGDIKNNGYRDITGLFLKVNFLDKDGAVMYEVAFYPQEPSLGTSGLQPVTIPYFSTPTKVILKPNGSLPFKTILTDCPNEILRVLQEKSGFAKNSGRWTGRLSSEVLSIDF